MDHLDDTQLCSAIREGDSTAFAVLVNRHTSRFFKLAAHTLQSIGDAEEVVQFVFLKYWRNPDQYDPSKAAFTTWFYRVVLNSCRDLIKKNNRSDAVLTDYIRYCDEHVQKVESDGEQKLVDRQSTRERQVALEYAISTLSIKQREALNLVLYSQLPQHEVATILGISLKALESIVHRAKKQLIEEVGILLNDVSTLEERKRRGSKDNRSTATKAKQPNTPISQYADPDTVSDYAATEVQK